MARESKRSQLVRYRTALNHAIRYREQEGYDSLWERMIDLYRGKHLPTTANEQDQLVVNIAFSTINVIYPSVSVNFPKITVAPNRPEDEDRAVFTEAVINYQWRHFDFQEQVRRAVKDALIIGHGWIKVGWRYTEREVPLDGPQMAQQLTELSAQVDEFAEMRPDLAAALPTDEEIADHLPQTTVEVEEDRPTVERVSPFDIYVDPEATSLDDARWIAQRIVRPIEDVRRDPRYKKSARLRVEPDLGVGHSEAKSRREWRKRHAVDPDDQRVTIWEFWDLHRKKFAVFADGGDEFLIEPMDMPYACGHPYVMFRNYDVPDYFYPLGDLEALECLQQELNALRTVHMQARRSFARKWLIRGRAFGPQSRAALESDEDGELVEVLDENTPFSDLIAAIPHNPIPPEIYAQADQVEQDMADVSGVSEYMRGQVPEVRRTATEAALINDHTAARAADKLAQIEKGMSRVARKVVQMNAQFLTQQMWARVVGPENSIFWVPYERDDVAGEFDFEVEAGSTQPRNETVRRQEAVQLAQAMGPWVQMGIVDPRQLARHLLQYGFGIRNPDKFLTPPVPMLPPGPEGEEAAEGGVGGPQPPPMGNGYADAETGMDPQAMAAMAAMG